MINGIRLSFLVSLIETNEFWFFDRYVFRASVKLIIKALLIGIIELKHGMNIATPRACIVA